MSIAIPPKHYNEESVSNRESNSPKETITVNEQANHSFELQEDSVQTYKMSKSIIAVVIIVMVNFIIIECAHLGINQQVFNYQITKSTNYQILMVCPFYFV